MVHRLGELFADGFRKTVPDAFVFAILLTLLVAGIALVSTDATPIDVIEGWYSGFWILLEFSAQISLGVIAGYCLAQSPPASKVIDWIGNRVKTPVGVYATVMIVGMLGCLVSFSWIIIAAVLGRELAQRVRGVHYPYLIACIYAAFNIWVCGLSSSIPLVLNTEGNFLIETGVLSETISTGRTLGGNMNLVFIAFSLLALPVIMIALRPPASKIVELNDLLEKSDLPPAPNLSIKAEAEATKSEAWCLSDFLNHFSLPQAILALSGLFYVGWHFWTNGFDVDLNIILFLLLMLGLLAHGSPARYAVAMKRSGSDVVSILYQFPMYSGIMGIVAFTGLGAVISASIASAASVETLPAIAYLTGGGLNLAVPSAGGEWAIIGGPILETARSLGSEMTPEELTNFMARVSMSVAYGESTSNYLQPFYLLLVLPVMSAGVRLQARDVMGYLAIPLIISVVFGLALVTWMPT